MAVVGGGRVALVDDKMPILGAVGGGGVGVYVCVGRVGWCA